MEDRSKIFVRADMVDIKRLDRQLEGHLNRVWALQNPDNKEKNVRSATAKEPWEIDSDKLIVKEVIGRGTFSAVHRGLYGGQDVAVKVLEWRSAQGTDQAETTLLRNAAFKQEVSVWHKLEHPNVVKFIGATMGTDFKNQAERIGMPSSTAACIIIEYLPWGTLKSYLIKNRKRKLAFTKVIRLALDLARGLKYLHSRKFVHRDVKTENVLLDKNHSLKLTDFGTACIQDSIPDEIGRTGTLGYMAPEMFENKPYSRKCDVYSFGICLWEMYCCDMPFPNVRFSELTSPAVYKILKPEIPNCCPSSFAKIITQCWDADPRKRPEMEEVVTMLEAIQTSEESRRLRSCFSFCHK
ncbi:serine/threonine-protein kinase STY13-like [Juglans microcarpa x Juglans regia]|uniref:serine/threonine-protein kinase STY13-like n=1 Tax=Juglans microcarpa x Juglans regia TaxID=2249226 RepID=UPI001B7D956E|nr:serine/threonine-protein kinase STY13-like [Juglans microcarpa x Juglans regia]